MDAVTVAAATVQFINFAFSFTIAAWKIYHGASSQPYINNYLHLASEIDRNPEIGIFRRFGMMNNLSLLYMQAEIASLEREFLAQHVEDGCSPCGMTKSYNFSMDRLRCSNGQGGTKQRDLLLAIQAKLKIYNKALSSQILSRAQLGPGSADIRAIRDLTNHPGLTSRLRDIDHLHENIWERAANAEDERKHLNDFLILSPASSSRSPLSASRADRGLLYKIELPFHFLWQRLSSILIAMAFVLSVIFSIINPFKSKETHDETLSMQTPSRNPSDETENKTTAAHIANPGIEITAKEADISITSPPSDSVALNTIFSSAPPQGNGAGARASTDIGPSKVAGKEITDNPIHQSTPEPVNLAPNTTGLDANNLIRQAPASGRDSPSTPSVENQASVFQVIDQISQPIARQYPVNEPVSNASNYAARVTAESFLEIDRDPGHILPVTEPKRSPMNKSEQSTLKILQERFTAKEVEKQFSNELSRLDRHHGPDLKSSMLSALFTTLPVLVLYYIRSLPFRLLAVILFTLVFAVGLSLTYRPKRGELFATTAAFAAVQVVFVGSSTL